MNRPTCLACTLLAASFLIASQAPAQVFQGPDTGSVASGVVVRTATFVTASPHSFGGPAFKEPRNKIPYLRDFRPPDVPATAPAALTTYVTDPSVTGVIRTAPPPIPLASVDGLGDPQTYIPPDTYIAAGLNHVILVDNGRFRILDKSGRTVQTIVADSWFGSALDQAGAFDPKVLYDHFAGRWIMVWLDQSDAEQRSFFLVSVSDDADPLGTWYNWALPAGVNGSTPAGNWADYQGVGFDQQALYITSNNWSFGGSYDYSKIRIIPKSDLYANTAGRLPWIDLWEIIDARGQQAFGIRPVKVYGSPSAYYFVSVPYGSGSGVSLFTLTDPLTSPWLTVQRVSVSAWTEAPNADQLGGSTTRIETFASMNTNEPTYFDGSVWLTHSIGTGNGYSSVRYLRISTVTATVEEDGALGVDGYWYFYPAIAVDKDKNVAITYTRSGESAHAGSFMTWRLASDPPGELRPSVQLQAGRGNYVVTGGDGRNRWGDYNGIVVDPSTMEEFWMYSEYAAATNDWGNWVHNARLTPYPEKRVFPERLSHNFGRTEAGSVSDTATFRVYNVGATPLTISSASVSSPAFRLIEPLGVPRQLGTWDTLTVRAVFTPAQAGDDSTSIIVQSDDASRPAVSLALRGRGVVIGTAQPGVMYAAGGSPGSRIYSVDRQAATSAEIGASGVQNIRGLAVHPVTRELHATVPRTRGTDIVRISSGSGDALPMRTIPIDNLRGFVYAGPDTIIGVGFTSGDPYGKVYRIGPSDNDTVTLSVNPSALLSGIARDAASGSMWASVTPPLVNRDRIYSLDPVSGALTVLGRTNLGQAVPSLAMDPAGTLFGIQANGALIRIDQATGAGTLVGNTAIPSAAAITILADTTATGVGSEFTAGIPTASRLEQNYPNPFNPTTEIRFAVAAPQGQSGAPRSSHVKLTVYDLLGREVAVLVDEEKAPGSYSVMFNASRLASGVYLYRLSTGSYVETKKMTLTR